LKLFLRKLIRAMSEPKHAAEELTVKLSIELTELVELYKSYPRSGVQAHFSIL